jgi:hypothetical protein
LPACNTGYPAPFFARPSFSESDHPAPSTQNMTRYITTLFLLLSTVSLLFSQQDDILSIDSKDLPDARFQPARTFNGESLFGYIDGGAELYLEYGFSVVWVSEIEYMKGKYKIEIYRMKGAEEAFGIFSVSKFRCLSSPPVATYSCQTRYQLQICSGPFYISIINRTGTDGDSIASLNIASSIARKIKENPVDLSRYLPGIPHSLIREKALLLKGKLGLMNGAPDWEDYFKGISDYTLVILPEEGKTTLSVRFQSAEGIEKLVKLHNWDKGSLTSEMFKVSYNESIMKLSGSHLLIEVSE